VRTSRSIAPLALLLAIAGCRSAPPPPPALTEVAPSEVELLGEARLVIRGERFRPLVHPQLDRPATASDVNARFQLRLHNEVSEVLLESVELFSETELRATVPRGATTGLYALELTDPRGRVVELTGALRVVAAACPEVEAPICLLDGVCVEAGTVQPGVACRVCDPSQAVDDFSPASDGVSCEDGDLCTTGERCTAGACVGAAQVQCPARACFDAGTCDPATGRCSNQFDDGTPCDDGDPCSVAESCQDGTCIPRSVTRCVSTSCKTSSCQADGGCLEVAQPPSAPCDDGNLCTTTDRCIEGVCRGSSICNTAPRACFTVSPSSGAAGSTFTFDARCTFDPEDTPDRLQARWDFDGDGTFDTAMASALVVTRLMPTSGLFTARVEVRDQGGLNAFGFRSFSVQAASDLVVTTQLDENNFLSSPALPGGTGFSLREAIGFANNQVGPRVIRFSGPMQVRASSLPALTLGGATLFGGHQVVLDFTPAPDGGTCFTLDGADQRMVGLELHSCGGDVLAVRGVRSQVTEVTFLRGARDGGGVQLMGNETRFGPFNAVSGFSGPGVTLAGNQARVERNRVISCGEGIQIAQTSQSMLLQNELLQCGGAGVSVTRPAPGAQLWHNTLVGNGEGISFASAGPPVSLRNNLVAYSKGRGVSAGGASFSASAPNLFFANAGGDFFTGVPDAGAPAGSLLEDPRFVGLDAGDLSLAPSSPAINAGADLGVDVNGPGPGNFDGTAPDLGSRETR
jgi:hypothetical protein